MIERKGLLAAAVAGWVFVLIVQGAVPFLAIPTLGQAVWSMGFAQSFEIDGCSRFMPSISVPRRRPALPSDWRGLGRLAG
jgi:hypothetical protein